MRSFMRRAGWLFLASLFIFTGIGVGVIAFYQSTHQNNSTTPPPPPPSANSCSFASAPAETLPAPAVFKPDGAVTSLSTTDLSTGNGQAVKSGDCITAKYYGTLASSGKIFDQDFDKPQAIKFPIGKGQVIPGWDQGLVGVKVGGTQRLVIPAALGYGPTGACQTHNAKDPNKCDVYSIPPNADLVFVVKIEAVQ